MKTYAHLFWIAIGVILLTKQAHAIDLQPGEIRASKPSVNLLQLSYQHS